MISSTIVLQTLKRYIHIKKCISKIKPYNKITMNSEFWDAPDLESPTVNEKIRQWLELIRGVIYSSKYSRTPATPNKKRKKSVAIISRVIRTPSPKKTRSQLTNIKTPKLPSLHRFSCDGLNFLGNKSTIRSSKEPQVPEKKSQIWFFEELQENIARLSDRLKHLESVQSEFMEHQQSLAASAASCTCGALKQGLRQSPRASRHIQLSQHYESDQEAHSLSPHSGNQSRKHSNFASPKQPKDSFLKSSADNSESFQKHGYQYFTTRHLHVPASYFEDASLNLQINIENSQRLEIDERENSPESLKKQGHPKSETSIKPPRTNDRCRSLESPDGSDIAEEWPYKVGLEFPAHYFQS